MRAQMPKKLWRNLPEAEAIPEMVAQASTRTQRMIRTSPSKPNPRVKHWAPEAAEASISGDETLESVAEEAAECTRCPLYKNATQTVFGEGPEDAEVVFVGEQPGDQEDLAGRPFVGPAGQLFDRALADAGIDRSLVYVTNAVKHFKFEPRGKRRIHKTPTTGEIDICRWWLDKELSLLKPKLVVALGGTAARSVTGRAVTISRERGRLIKVRPELEGLITVHPSYMLRIPDEQSKAQEYSRFVEDLKLVVKMIPSLRKASANLA